MPVKTYMSISDGTVKVLDFDGNIYDTFSLNADSDSENRKALAQAKEKCSEINAWLNMELPERD